MIKDAEPNGPQYFNFSSLQLGNFQLPADVKPGDWLVFDQCGAYGFTESMPYFLCHDLPGEAVWDGDEVRWARPPQPASAWLRKTRRNIFPERVFGRS